MQCSKEELVLALQDCKSKNANLSNHIQQISETLVLYHDTNKDLTMQNYQLNASLRNKEIQILHRWNKVVQTKMVDDWKLIQMVQSDFDKLCHQMEEKFNAKIDSIIPHIEGFSKK